LELLKNELPWIHEKRNHGGGVSKLKQSWFELVPIQEPTDQGGMQMDEAAPREALSATEEFQKLGLSVQAPSSPNNDNVVHQIMTDVSETVSQEDGIVVIRKVVLNATKWLLDFIGHLKS
jgi:hypothetical protein